MSIVPSTAERGGRDHDFGASRFLAKEPENRMAEILRLHSYCLHDLAVNINLMPMLRC